MYNFFIVYNVGDNPLKNNTEYALLKNTMDIHDKCIFHGILIGVNYCTYRPTEEKIRYVISSFLFRRNGILIIFSVSLSIFSTPTTRDLASLCLNRQNISINCT